MSSSVWSYPPVIDPAAVRGASEIGTVTSYDQGMDAYVVLHFKGSRVTVLGAGADEDSAEEIAHRHGLGYVWRPWERQEDLGRRIRIAMGSSETQTITKVPLASEWPIIVMNDPEVALTWNGSTDPAADLRGFDSSKLATLGYATDNLNDKAWSAESKVAPPTFAQMIELTRKLRPAPMQRDKIRCGSGEAWRWMGRALDGAALYPSETTLPDSVAARVMGIDVVLDPNMPPDMIRFGSKLFMIRGNEMLSLDLDQLPMLDNFPHH
jgi:hypothetical protein